ncbi:DUF4270 domain-containing protein [Hymenobacter sp. HSC-4F20]|uniref:DUF4270 family protein n=1 Tax=Hymenobacter sp. HSC-4F20 TaxID=2864135 RepID=UPI001C72D005|nr:DUF4270 family protein [Hymenobacter sp. HSC-4F20]MBX0291919.1 DUF4270 domain-containing protein [Hymenobacter sp. HSC-4F20]
MNWPASASRLPSVSLFAVSLLVLASCEKANDLGLELPGTSPITSQYLDLPVATYTVRQQPVETVNSDYVLVGRLRDSKVGTTTAQGFLNLQYNATLSPPDSLPSKTARLDSVVFSLGFNQVYGTTSQPLRFNFATLQQPLDARTVYNSASAGPSSTVLLTNIAAPLNREIKVWQQLSTNTTNNRDSVQVTVVDKVLRLRLLKYPATTTLANSTFAALQDASFNQDKLDAVWKGILLTPTANFADNIVAFSRSFNSRVVFYFSGTNASGKNWNRHAYSLVAGPLPANALTAGPKYFTQITTDLSGTPLASLTTSAQQVSSAATDEYTYLQDGTGLATRLEFQGLQALTNKPELAVNRAELLLPIQQNTNGLFPYPANVFLYEANASNQVLTRAVGATSYERLVQAEGVVQNVRITPTSVGSPASAVLYPSYDAPQYYSVPLTEYLQAYLQNRLEGELPSALLLSPILRTDASLTLNRAQLDAKNIKLRVYYSNLR